MPKLPDMPMFNITDKLAPPTFDLAQPILKQGTENNFEFDMSKDYYYKPPFVTLPAYSDENELRSKFKPLKNFNKKIDLASLDLPNSNFFIIRSNNSFFN